MESYYSLLELTPEASQKEIKASYRLLCQQYHPDKLPPGTPEKAYKYVEERFKQINQAFSTLSDQKKRQEYDKSLGLNSENWQEKPVSNAPKAPEEKNEHDETPESSTVTPFENRRGLNRKAILSRRKPLIVVAAISGLCMSLFWISSQLKIHATQAELKNLTNQENALAVKLNEIESSRTGAMQRLENLEAQLEELTENIDKPNLLLKEQQLLQTSRENAMSLLEQRRDRPLAQAVSWCTVNKGYYPCSTNIGCPPNMCSEDSYLPEGFPTTEYEWKDPLADYELKFLDICKRGFTKVGYEHCESYRSKVEIDLTPEKILKLDKDIKALEEELPFLEEKRTQIVASIEPAKDDIRALSQEKEVTEQGYREIRSKLEELQYLR